jgi:hypothetical protein
MSQLGTKVICCITTATQSLNRTVVDDINVPSPSATTKRPVCMSRDRQAAQFIPVDEANAWRRTYLRSPVAGTRTISRCRMIAFSFRTPFVVGALSPCCLLKLPGGRFVHCPLGAAGSQLFPVADRVGRRRCLRPD